MSRTRLISPKFFTNADLYDAEVDAKLPLRLVYAGLWTVTDRRGVFRWSRNLKPEVLPYDPCDILACLDALERAGFVRSYEVAGRKYGFIPTFVDHQTFHHREAASQDPAPPWATDPASAPGAGSGPSAESLGPSPAKAGASPTASASASVTASASGTASASASVPPRPAAAGALARVEIARVANDALDAAFGTTHRRPLLAGTAAAVLEVIEQDAIPLDFACDAIRDAVPALKEPPRSLAYFAPIVRERWETRTSTQPPRRAGKPASTGRAARNRAALAAGLAKLEGREVANG